jgi:hypothetical protein
MDQGLWRNCGSAYCMLRLQGHEQQMTLINMYCFCQMQQMNLSCQSVSGSGSALERSMKELRVLIVLDAAGLLPVHVVYMLQGIKNHLLRDRKLPRHYHCWLTALAACSPCCLHKHRMDTAGRKII